MFKPFRKTPPPAASAALDPDKMRVTLVIEAFDPVQGEMRWEASETVDRTEEALEAAETRLIIRSLNEVCGD